MTLISLLSIVTAFGLAYSLLTAASFGRRVMAERPARRRGLLLNLVRRALPPVVIGGAILALGGVVGRSAAAPAGWAILSAGLAYGLHRGMADMGQTHWRTIWPRVALTLVIALTALWQFGVV